MEALWTRFAPSELASIGDQPVEVHADTRVLVQRAVEGYELTDGLFNPFLVEQVEAAGYDRDFDELSSPVVPRPATPGDRAEVVMDDTHISSTQAIDSGGIGKGLAADLVADRLIRAGAQSALVNIGGDLRCIGQGPGGRWNITIETPIDLPTPLSVKLDQGAVCTSTPLLRAWDYADGGIGHHLIDPRTGRPAESDFASVSVIAREAWLAEVLSKAVLLAPGRRARFCSATTLAHSWSPSTVESPSSEARGEPRCLSLRLSGWADRFSCR